ncbi:LysR family transcriptional regulator [Vibrio crassostreae]|uniref:LysR family transcriptional regulator n=1 Tax=Vibrio crassostreae TaxID=246167 RepID=UPI001051E914|nr:LysR family transcriptional regulator [Vibrio crassostreae]TCO01312.1 DNA-binding transcriptional LysR family regulator [Vibrio crassostreae]CAK2101580.1 DNA-binding transcriptional LysR family regulator [Vibrio crassostreae]CAK2101633.1 DNA-binding transcriptional LysR family regulator [Vibrio crassostreae]CAK2109964.1 DNA-binding transcriptional LysR family regulator [Vibrio crassostreae]CAK2893699.1 DNA-binding transcriptional LysR family regulator [Vibrio crassostreae]
MELMNNELICFAAVCKHLSLTEASKELGKSKAQVSRQLAALEKQIGVTLVHRTTRKLVLTDHGESIKELAIEALDNLQALNYRAKSLSDCISGKFKITMPNSVASSIFGEILKGLKERYPAVNFEVSSNNNVENLLESNIDIAIRLNNVVDETLIAHEVGNYNDIVISQIDNTQNNTLLIYKRHSNKEEIKKRYSDVIEVDNTSILMNFVSKGVGVGVIPNYLMKGSQINKNIHITQVFDTERSMYIAYPYQNPLPRKLVEISAFIRMELDRILN